MRKRGFLEAWPALETRWDGAWVWRFARGYTKRANAIQCQDPADDGDAEARLMRMADWSHEAGIAPIFRQTPLCGAGVIGALDRLGWAPFEKSRILYLNDLSRRFAGLPSALRCRFAPGRPGSARSVSCRVTTNGRCGRSPISSPICRIRQSGSRFTTMTVHLSLRYWRFRSTGWPCSPMSSPREDPASARFRHKGHGRGPQRHGRSRRNPGGHPCLGGERAGRSALSRLRICRDRHLSLSKGSDMTANRSLLLVVAWRACRCRPAAC